MFKTDNEQTIDHAVEALRCLSDRNRLRILTALTRAETCVGDLIAELGIPQPLASYHLGKLRRLGLIRARRDARWVYYSLDPDAWAAFTADVLNLLQPGPLPPAAAYGAACRAADELPSPTRTV